MAEKRRLVWRLLPVQFVAVVAFALSAWLLLPHYTQKSAEKSAIVAATQTAEYFKLLRAYYTDRVVRKVLEHGGGLSVHHDHKNLPNAVPLPASLIHDMGDLLMGEAVNLDFYSPYPFANRAERRMDEFGHAAWAALSLTPGEYYTRTEEIGGRHVVRVAVADLMVSPVCVECHNHHPMSPKNDWKLGDLRGVLEVSADITGEVADGKWLGRNLALALLVVFGGITLFSFRQTVANVNLWTRQLETSEASLAYENRLHGVLRRLLSIQLVGRSLENCLDEALDVVLGAPFAELLPKGGVFLAEGESLTLTVQSNLSEPLLDLCADVPFGRCMCGRAAREEAIVFADHLDERHDIRFDGIAEHGHYCVPLISRRRVVGVLALYVPHRHVRSEQEERFLEAVGLIMAMIIEGKRAEEALIHSRNEAQAANRAKSQFLANMSHELRTPMHAILSFAAMGGEKLETVTLEKLGGYFERIQSSGDRLMSLLNGLLDLAKLEAGRMEFHFAGHSLEGLARTAVEELSELAARKAITIELPEGDDTSLECDGERLLQVFRNLLGNAIKFSPVGSVIRIGITPSRLPADRRSHDGPTVPALQVVVADEGVGIPEDELASIFDAFIQSSKTDTGSGGTGLGLAICREIVESHGGAIEARNNPGGGASFLFTLPVVGRREASSDSEE